MFCYNITYRVNILKLYIVYDGESGELKLSNVSKYSSYDFILYCLGNSTKKEKNYDIFSCFVKCAQCIENWNILE